MCNSKAIKICPNQHADLFGILFTKDSLKIKKGLELVSRPHFIILHKLAIFHYQTVLTSQVIQ